MSRKASTFDCRYNISSSRMGTSEISSDLACGRRPTLIPAEISEVPILQSREPKSVIEITARSLTSSPAQCAACSFDRCKREHGTWAGRGPEKCFAKPVMLALLGLLACTGEFNSMPPKPKPRDHRVDGVRCQVYPSGTSKGRTGSRRSALRQPRKPCSLPRY